jgi:hypothetical protein
VEAILISKISSKSRIFNDWNSFMPLILTCACDLSDPTLKNFVVISKIITYFFIDYHSYSTYFY